MRLPQIFAAAALMLAGTFSISALADAAPIRPSARRSTRWNCSCRSRVFRRARSMASMK